MSTSSIAWKLAAVTALVVTVVVVSSRRPQGSVKHEQVREDIASPNEWVPFSAVVRKLEPGKTTTVVGRLNRGSDGSRRLESGLPGRSPSVISINNFTRLETFIFSSEYGWYQLPMPLPEHARRPSKFYVDNVKTFRHAEKIEGFDLLRMVHGSGQIALVAPALNGEALVRQGPDGSRTVLSDVVIGDQALDLFEPPPGTVFRPAPAPVAKSHGPHP